MNTAERVGTVSALWRFPVKSMAGELLETAEVTQGGIAGDRAYALVDTESGKVVSAKHPKKWPNVLDCGAEFIEPPVAGREPPPVRIDLSDGTSVTSHAADADAVLSNFFGREVRLASAAQNGYTIEQYHPDLDYDPEHRNELTDVSLGAAFFNERGLPSAVPEGSFFDLFPLSVLTTSTLDRLAQLQPESNFDARRFRMNIIVDAAGSDFVENDWIGKSLQVGDDVRLAVALPDPRCVMPSLAQPGLPRDGEILRTLAKHNRIEVAGGGLYPCAGVYAVSQTAGTVRVGDSVSLV